MIHVHRGDPPNARNCPQAIPASFIPSTFIKYLVSAREEEVPLPGGLPSPALLRGVLGGSTPPQVWEHLRAEGACGCPLGSCALKAPSVTFQAPPPSPETRTPALPSSANRCFSDSPSPACLFRVFLGLCHQPSATCWDGPLPGPPCPSSSRPNCCGSSDSSLEDQESVSPHCPRLALGRLCRGTYHAALWSLGGQPVSPEDRAIFHLWCASPCRVVRENHRSIVVPYSPTAPYSP